MIRPYGASIESDIGFADGELLSYERTSTETLSVTLTAWDESQITVLFGGVIAVLDLGAGGVSNLVTSAAADAELLGLALERYYEVVPSEHPYRSYSFLNHEDEPSLVVVAISHELHYRKHDADTPHGGDRSDPQGSGPHLSTSRFWLRMTPACWLSRASGVTR